MQELKITWERVARVWWLLVWRGLLGGWILAVVLAFLIGEAGGRLELPSHPQRPSWRPHPAPLTK